MLLDYWDRDKLKLGKRDVELARDSYDNCIAALDRQIGALLKELERRGVLNDTLVIITSDHGEQFGEHGVFNHGFSLYAAEVHVPLLLIGGAVPSGSNVSEPVSLRRLPATVVDLLGLSSNSTFLGRSLAECWRTKSGGEKAGSSPAVSEVDIPLLIGPERGRGPNQRGFTMSLVDEGLHYLLDIRGTEELYDLSGDPRELRDLKNDPSRIPALGRFRNSLGQILRDNRAKSAVAADYKGQFQRFLHSLSPLPPG
jgi:arylsulfatase A-like enzyme